MLPNSAEATEFERTKRPCQGNGGDLTKRLHCVKMVAVAGAIEAHLDHSRATPQTTFTNPTPAKAVLSRALKLAFFCRLPVAGSKEEVR